MTRKAALAVFGILVAVSPLLFGTVDRFFQILLTCLFAVGLACVPIAVQPPSRAVKWGLAALVAILVLKEVLPFPWFGEPAWRRTLSQSFGLVFPKTHHPEPGRAVDALLTMTIGALWFCWVRTLTRRREDRQLIAWLLFGGAVLLAAACLFIPTQDGQAIFGLRYTHGWKGYGPFPNRNHTACVLAIGAIIGSGCISRAAARRHWPQLAGGMVLLLFIIIALLKSHSRGGLLVCAAGLGLFSLAVVCKLRNRYAIAGAAAGAVILGVIFFQFGAKTLARFYSANEGGMNTNLRWDIWSDTLRMWEAAPLFGHGVNTFGQLFPLYQEVQLANQYVLHPESSWLQWLVEIGALPLGLALVLFVVFVTKNAREAWSKTEGFYFRVAGFAAVAALLLHAVWDVPAHSWTIGAYGLAMLAIACPGRRDEATLDCRKRIALVPMCIALFWALPVFIDRPAWSPLALNRLRAKAINSTTAKISELQTGLRYFPLNAELHHALGLRLLALPGSKEPAWRHFRIVDRLLPGSWSHPALHATAAQRYSPGMALHFWTIAIERAGERGGDVLHVALRQTADLSAAETFWERYTMTNPQFLLVYAGHAGETRSGEFYQAWWESRRAAPKLHPKEVQDFYGAVAKWGEPAHLEEWMRLHPEWEARDCKHWAALWHGWNDHRRAWELLSRQIAEPPYPAIDSSPEQLEPRWVHDPSNSVHAQAYAAALHRSGDKDNGDEVILSFVAEPGAPSWFRRKAAYIRAARGDFQGAVELLLRD